MDNSEGDRKQTMKVFFNEVVSDAVSTKVLGKRSEGTLPAVILQKLLETKPQSEGEPHEETHE